MDRKEAVELLDKLIELLGWEELEAKIYFIVSEMIKHGDRYDSKLEKDYIKNDVEEALEIIRTNNEEKLEEAKLFMNSLYGKSAKNAGFTYADTDSIHVDMTIEEAKLFMNSLYGRMTTNTDYKGEPKTMTHEEIIKVVGSNIRKARKEKGLYQFELADLVGVGRNSIIKIESGKRHANLWTLISIAKGLELEISELFKGTH